MMCKKCGKMTSFLVLAGGVLFLLRDLGIWNFWNISWWTFVLLIAGFCMCGRASCPDCDSPGKKGKK